MEQKLKFEDLPEAVENIQTQLSDLRRLLTSDIPKEKQLSNKPKNSHEAARFIGKSVSTIYRLVSQRRINFHKQSGKLYFFEDELIDWIKSGRDL
jgi:excisionase family DNA binding protein